MNPVKSKKNVFLGIEMKVYQIGGAVRDFVLGRKATDLDYVVVGATVQEMIEKGFYSVGKNFPVFLHPKTKNEYALARKEIKIGDKHTDFKFIFDASVSLKEDVMRRDFTMNALAFDEETNEIIDYVGGKKDIEKKCIRHIHPIHFKEDGLRVLRMCRFAAQLDFSIAPETMILAQEMVKEGALLHLSKERIFNEFQRALQTERFDVFVEKMKECGALKQVLPEIEALFSMPEKEEYHPEKNAGEHTLLSLKAAKEYDPIVKFAVLLHDVGKILTPEGILPGHYGHDIKGIQLIKEICSRLKVPKKYEKTALIACEYHMLSRKFPLMSLSDLYFVIKKITKEFKNKEILENLFLVCLADLLGRGKLLEQKEFDNLSSARARCFHLFEEVKKIKITQMTDFQNILKKKDFKEKADAYVLNILKTKRI